MLETCKLAEDEEASKALESRILTFEGRYAEASELRSEALDGDEMIGRLYRANAFIEAIEKRQGLKIACPEEIAYDQGFIGRAQFQTLIEALPRCDYRQYLERMLQQGESA